MLPRSTWRGGGQCTRGERERELRNGGHASALAVVAGWGGRFSRGGMAFGEGELGRSVRHAKLRKVVEKEMKLYLLMAFAMLYGSSD